MSSDPVTPTKTPFTGANVIATPPYSGPREAWIPTPEGWKKWSANPISPTKALTPYVPSAPFGLSPTNPNGMYPPRPALDSSPDPVRRVLFPGPAKITAKSAAEFDAVASAVRAQPLTPPTTSIYTPPRPSDSSLQKCVRVTESLVRPANEDNISDGEAPNSQPNSTALITRRYPQDMVFERWDDGENDDILVAVDPDQEREMAEMVSRASINGNMKKRRHSTIQSDEDVSYVGRMRPVQRGRLEAPEDGCCETCGRSNKHSGKLPVSSKLSRKVQANAIRAAVGPSLMRTMGRSWEELAESFGATRAGDAERLRHWWRSFGDALPKAFKDGTI